MKDLCQKRKVKLIFRGARNSLMAWPDWPWHTILYDRSTYTTGCIHVFGYATTWLIFTLTFTIVTCIPSSGIIMPRPIGGSIKRWCCLTSVCLTSVWRRLTSVAYIRPAGGLCGRSAGMARIGLSDPARPTWLKAAAARFHCRGRGHIVAAFRTACFARPKSFLSVAITACRRRVIELCTFIWLAGSLFVYLQRGVTVENKEKLHAVECNPGQVVHTHDIVPHCLCHQQYNWWEANGRWRLVARKVTAGLAESRPNAGLPSGLWLPSPTGWLPRTGISSGTPFAPTSSTTFTFFTSPRGPNNCFDTTASITVVLLLYI